MSLGSQPIRDFMTSAPLAISPEMTIEDARVRMRIDGVRHLPVVTKTAILGMVSATDVVLFESLEGARPDRVPVEAAMAGDVVFCGPDESLREVVIKMAERKVGAMLVVEDQAVLGIFTYTDAIELFARQLLGA